jgi:diguanylate cyclase (GGDEF)-like protein/PAS domain S-box-containing protein
LSPVYPFYLTYVPVMLLPITLWFATRDAGVYQALAFMTVVFATAILSAGRNYSQHFNHASKLAAALQASESRLREIIDLVPVQIFARDSNGRIMLANVAMAKFFGRDVADLVNTPLTGLCRNAEEAAAQLARDRVILSGAKAELSSEERVTDRAMRPRTMRSTRVQFTDPISGKAGVLGVSVDVTEELAILKALKETEARFSSAFANAPIGMMLVTDTGRVLNANRVAANIFEVGSGFWADREFWQLALADDAALIHDKFDNLLAGRDDVFTVETQHTTYIGRPIWVMLCVSRVPECDAAGVRAIVQIQDVTRARTMADQLAYQATHDPLTELLNRRECETRLARTIESVRVDNTQHALLFIDLDKFKIVNDSCGHTAGDDLLREVAEIIKSQVRKHDTVARLGGDEFAVILEHCSRDQATQIATKICKAIGAHRFAWDGKAFNVSSSIGVVDIASPDTTLPNLIKAADAACYAAKESGRNRVYVFHPDDEDLNRRRIQIDSVAQINAALEDDRFVLYAQPIQGINDGKDTRATHIEILLRMLGADDELILPGLFLPAAERYGLAPRIDRWVIAKTLDWFGRHPSQLQELELCSINVSGQSLTDQNFEEFIESRFAASALPGDKFCFEITETAAIASISNAQKFIERIRRLGCLFALDDFGSGLSSFGYLKTLPIDILKIDGIFIRDLVSDELDAAMVRSINEVAKLMNKTTVAEFVECEAQRDRLKTIGVDYVQGYFVGKPERLEDFFARSAVADRCRQTAIVA